MKPRQFIFLLCVVVFSSCLKDAVIQPNVHTSISGQFYDQANKEIYAGVKIRIGAYQGRSTFEDQVYDFVGYVDSTTTDNNGNFNISFTTKGNASDYFFEYKLFGKNVYATPIGGGVQSDLKIDSLGKNFVCNFNVIKNYYLKLRLQVNNNPYPPLSLIAGNKQTYFSSYLCNVFGTNNDTVKYIQIQKNSGGFNLFFSVKNPTTGATYQNDPISINPVITSDTTDGGTYTLNPSNFK